MVAVVYRMVAIRGKRNDGFFIPFLEFAEGKDGRIKRSAVLQAKRNACCFDPRHGGYVHGILGERTLRSIFVDVCILRAHAFDFLHLAQRVRNIFRHKAFHVAALHHVKEQRVHRFIVAELGDKISGEEKAKVEAEIENVKKALETNNTDTIKEATEKLTQAFYQISEQLYKQNAAANGANAAGAEGQNASDAGTANNDGNVYDADYKVEDNGDNK